MLQFPWDWTQEWLWMSAAQSIQIAQKGNNWNIEETFHEDLQSSSRNTIKPSHRLEMYTDCHHLQLNIDINTLECTEKDTLKRVETRSCGCL